MAYMTADGKGPYPCDAGEYCGNHLLGSKPLPLRDLGETPEEAEKWLDQMLDQMRFGRPRPCKAGSSKEMSELGYVGLYLKSPQPLWLGGTRVPTPDELREPR